MFRTTTHYVPYAVTLSSQNEKDRVSPFVFKAFLFNAFLTVLNLL